MEEFGLLERFLLECGPYVRKVHENKADMAVTEKGLASDLLTEADLEVQRRAVAAIAEAFPGDTVLAEEEGLGEHCGAPPRRCWVLDPIDGTNNFVRGLFPVFCISLAFCQDGTAECGGILLPGTGDLFLARRGGGAALNGKPLAVSRVTEFEAARIEIDLGLTHERAAMLARATNVILKGGQLRCCGAAAVALCQVASGDLDAFVHMNLNPWDFAAGQLLVEEAGGVATRLDGTPLHPLDGGRGVLISNGPIHAKVLAELSDVEPDPA